MSEAADLLKGTTPGPWVHGNPPGKIVPGPCGVWGPDGALVATAEWGITRRPETVGASNARLIAAAPDLARRLAEAEALVWAARSHLAHVRAFDDREYRQIVNEWFARAEALLTGKSIRAEP